MEKSWPTVRPVCLGLFALVVTASPAQAQEFDVLAYSIDASIEGDQLVETVTLTATSRRPVKALDLELASSMELLACRLDDAEVPFERAQWDLKLDLKAAGSPRGEFTLHFELQGSPYNNQRNRFIRTVISEERAYIRSQYAWYPRRPDDPATYVTRLTVPQEWLVRTAGDLVEQRSEGDRRVWTFTLDAPCRNVGLAAGPYVVVERQGEGGIELDALVSEEHRAGAARLLEIAEQAIGFYSTLLGTIDQERFTLVEMPAAFGGGSGYGETGYALIGCEAFEDPEGATWAESLVAHEVAHTWWGREVLFDDFANEMLATYSTLRYLEEIQGDDPARDERRRFVQRISAVASQHELVALDTIRGWGGNTHPAVYSACAYDRAAMLLHALEREMGRERFDKALGRLFEANRGKSLDYASVRKALGGSRYKRIFDQWGSAALPTLREEHVVEESRSSFRVSGTLRQEGTDRPFAMEVTLRTIGGFRYRDHVVRMKKHAVEFEFSCPFEPQRIVIDPHYHLIRGLGAPPDLKTLDEKIFAVANDPDADDAALLERTIETIREVLAMGPASESVYHTALGRCLFRLGDLDRAVEEFEIALKGGAGGPFHRAWIHLRLGCIHDLRGERDEAVSYYEKTLAAPEKYAAQRSRAVRFSENPYRGYAIDG